MYYIAHYQSPLGNITMASDGKSLVGLWFEGQKYYGAGIGLDCQVRPTLPIFSLTCCWLNEYFSSREPSFTPPILLLGSTFRQRVWNELLKIPYGSTVSYGATSPTSGYCSTRGMRVGTCCGWRCGPQSHLANCSLPPCGRGQWLADRLCWRIGKESAILTNGKIISFPCLRRNEEG